MKIRKRGGNLDWQQDLAPDWTASLVYGVSEAMAAIFTLVSWFQVFIVSETQTGWGFIFTSSGRQSHRVDLAHVDVTPPTSVHMTRHRETCKCEKEHIQCFIETKIWIQQKVPWKLT